MNKNIILTIANTLLLSALLCSCSSTNYLTLGVVEPAPVYVPQTIKKIGIIDQTMPSEGTKKLDNLDKILSAEGKNLDKDGAYASVDGLYNELKKNDRFSDVRLITNSNIQSPGMGVLPAPLPWSTINKLCQENKVDALFVLSLYDTDARVEYLANPIEINGPLGVKIPGVEHHASIHTVIKTGWRIYDPAGKIILDEFLANKDIVQTGRGINPVQAAQAIIGRKEAVIQTSTQLGQNYSYRILPYSVRVRRNYYVRGTENFKIAKRRAQTGNWDGAGELWSKEVANPKSKVAGRATYNMAIINEINGDLNAAIDWASKSYTDYRNKEALEYLRILKNRRAKNEQLRQETQE